MSAFRVIRRLRDLLDVDTTGAVEGDALVLGADGVTWVPGAGGGGGGGAPTDAPYLVTTANGDLSAEVVVGATPGGELGGTWASPTVDATHSGSSHASVQAAAEATAAAALLGHTSDATDAHAGSAITNTPAGNLAATTVQGALNELDTEKAAASHVHAGEDITSGTVADARIAATIARDSEVTAAVAAEATARDTAIGVETSARTTADGLLVPKSLYDANTILAADTDNTPAAVTMGASTILARLAAGNIKAATPAEIRTLLGIGTVGLSQLVYRYTVTGADKLSIDTGVDTPDAGSNDWTNGDLLEIFLYARSDEAAVLSSLNVNVNNDTSALYDMCFLDFTNGGIVRNTAVSQTKWSSSMAIPGSTEVADYFGTSRWVFPNYMGTVGFKVGEFYKSHPSSTAVNGSGDVDSLGWRSTAAISRIALAPATSGKKFKVGSQLLVYKRLAS